MAGWTAILAGYDKAKLVSGTGKAMLLAAALQGGIQRSEMFWK